jgi:hypothetical protein
MRLATAPSQQRLQRSHFETAGHREALRSILFISLENKEAGLLNTTQEVDAAVAAIANISQWAHERAAKSRIALTRA